MLAVRPISLRYLKPMASHGMIRWPIDYSPLPCFLPFVCEYLDPRAGGYRRLDVTAGAISVIDLMGTSDEIDITGYDLELVMPVFLDEFRKQNYHCK